MLFDRCKFFLFCVCGKANRNDERHTFVYEWILRGGYWITCGAWLVDLNVPIFQTRTLLLLILFLYRIMYRFLFVVFGRKILGIIYKLTLYNGAVWCFQQYFQQLSLWFNFNHPWEYKYILCIWPSIRHTG